MCECLNDDYFQSEKNITFRFMFCKWLSARERLPKENQIQFGLVYYLQYCFFRRFNSNELYFLWHKIGVDLW